MTDAATERVFAGSIPKIYETNDQPIAIGAT